MVDPQPTPGPTRRHVLAGATALGVAGAAGVSLVTATAAEAATPDPDDEAGSSEALVARVKDARTGVVDLYVGERHVQVHDRDLARRLARAAR